MPPAIFTNLRVTRSGTPSSPRYHQLKPTSPSDPQRPVLSWSRGTQVSATATTSRAAINRANSRHSTGPRTPAGKQRSSINALRHGLMAARAVLPSEDRTAYDAHCRGFFEEYEPATPTETQLVQEVADTAWRISRVPLLEAALLDRADSDIVNAHRALATLGLHYQGLSRQFQKSLDTLREIQSDRAERQRRDLKDAAALLELHKHKGIPWEPADHGFVFSKHDVERFAQRTMRLNESLHIEHVRFHMPSTPVGHAAASF